MKTLWEKGENAGYQHFLPFPQCFRQAFFFQDRENQGLCGNSNVRLHKIFQAVL